MVVTEIFKSIQGESTFVGLPCVFIRLTGCNLRCHWCDTAYAFYGGNQHDDRRSPGAGSRIGWQIGGNYRWRAAAAKRRFAASGELLAEGYRVLVETSGERFVGNLPRDVVKVVDVKCPGSGESEKFCLDNLAALETKDEIKFVIVDENDYRYALDFIARHQFAQRGE